VRKQRLKPHRHRFPSLWRADKMPGGYVVRDASGQAIAYIYSSANAAEALRRRRAGAFTSGGKHPKDERWEPRA
jgi:hypothetical protein